MAAGGGSARQGVAQRAVARQEQMAGEDNGKIVADHDALEVDGHESNNELKMKNDRIVHINAWQGKRVQVFS
jgi:hypothetical protein